MKRIILSAAMASVAGLTAYSQSAIDAYRFSQPDLKGTARFMGMAGAFGALGGDLSTLSQNPAGIGVYRSNDIGLTVDLDFQKSVANGEVGSTSMTQTKFLLNNIGGVFTLKLPSTTVPNLNFGFTYNKGASFNRQYGGNISLRNSLSNYIAGVANSGGSNGGPLQVGDVTSTDSFDPYYPNDGGVEAPWLTILGYDGYLITPSGEGEDTQWFGQWGTGTSGLGRFKVQDQGSMDEYNIALGGNIANVVYWGMNFDIVNFNYTQNAYWGEQLNDAYVPDADDSNVVRTSADWSMHNYYNMSGSGFNYQIGVIMKPIQELRIGLAFHTPTWYNMTETYGADLNYKYGGTESGGAQTNNGQLAYNDMCFRSPMKFIASAAGVIGNSLIVSLDYEWTPYNKMKFSQAGSYGSGSSWDYGYDDPWWYGSASATPKTLPASATLPGSRASYWDGDMFYNTNEDIGNYYQSTNTIRIGAEYRVTPNFSVRAGYSYVSSPVKSEVKNGNEFVYTSGTMTNYRLDNETNYITCGLGYRVSNFYVDLAYVHKNMQSEYHAYTPDTGVDAIPSPKSKLSLSNNQLVLTAGVRF